MITPNNPNRNRLKITPKDIDEKTLGEAEKPIKKSIKEIVEPKVNIEEPHFLDSNPNPFDGGFNHDIGVDFTIPETGSMEEEQKSPFEFTDPIAEPSPIPSKPKVKTPPLDYPIEEQPNKPTNVIKHIVDPDTTYFFVFGLTSAGKSVMLSGLVYYLSAIHKDGQVKATGDLDSVHHKRGEYVSSQMQERVEAGEFVEPTKMINNTELVLPSEINLEYIPRKSESKSSMSFCLLEMAGEDLAQIQLTDGGNKGGKLDEKINAYLKNPDCNIAFICVVDPEAASKSQLVIRQFLNYTDKIGRGESPVLIAVSKWDKVSHEYDNDVNKYFEEKIPSLNRLSEDEDREYTKMGFSIGEVLGEKNYKFNPIDSEKLFKWIYETSTGSPYDQNINASLFSSIFSSIKSIFKK